MSPYSKEEYNAKYDKENTVQVKLKLNKATDKDIIDKLKETKNTQGYIKALIRADIENKTLRIATKSVLCPRVGN